MTIPKEIIEKAIEGGWADTRLKELPNWKVASRFSIIFWKELPLVGNHKTVPKQRQYLQMSSIALDPLFWQALGKALGWNDFRAEVPQLWRANALRFCNLIYTEQSTEEFWKELLK